MRNPQNLHLSKGDTVVAREVPSSSYDTFDTIRINEPGHPDNEWTIYFSISPEETERITTALISALTEVRRNARKRAKHAAQVAAVNGRTIATA